MAKLGKEIKDVIRGDSRSENLTFLQSDGSTPIPLGGGTVYFTVNSNSDPASDTTAVIQKIVVDPNFTNPTNGKTTITLTPTDTTIDAGSYWYDAEFVDSSGNKTSSYRGKFIVQSDITRT